MAKITQLKHALWLYLFATWTGVAYAAGNPLVDGLEAIPGKAFIFVLIISLIGGAYGTLSRLTRPGPPIIHLSVEIAKDIIGSILAGLMMFLVTSWFPFSVWWPQALAILVAGFGGSKFVDAVLNTTIEQGFMPALSMILQRFLVALGLKKPDESEKP